MNSDHPSPQQLAAFDAGSLPPDDREAVDRHIATCAACCGALETLPEDALAALMRAYAAPEPPVGVPVEAPSPWAVPAELIGHPRYRLLEVLGRGGMGVVYKAVHQHMDRVVALKVIHPALAARPGFAEQFRREAHAVGRLRHENLVAAYDADQAGDLHFLVMEYVEGESLEQAVGRRGPLPVEEACEAVRQAALGLQHAHERGLVHRDVKPSNLLRTREGRVKLVDFGLALLLDSDVPPSPSAEGAVLGTPDYASPEQARTPGYADARSDLYGLGCTLYFLLSGHPPFPAGTALQKLLSHQDRPPRPIRELRPDVPDAIVRLLDGMLAKDPASRPKNAGRVARDLLDGTANPAPPGPRPWKWVALALAVPLVAAAVAVALWPGEPAAEGPEEAPRPPDEVSVVSPPPPAAPPREPNRLAGAAELAAWKARSRDRAIDWLREKNRWGAGAVVVTQTAGTVGGWLGNSDGFQLILGPGIAKSGRPMVLAARMGDLFTFEVTTPPGRQLSVKPGHSTIRRLMKGKEMRRLQPTVILSDPKIEKADRLPKHERVRGTVAYRRTGSTDGPLQLRMVHYPGKGRVTGMFHLRPPIPAEQGTIAFDFGAIDEKLSRPGLPQVLYLELASAKGSEIIVESNTLAVLVWQEE